MGRNSAEKNGFAPAMFVRLSMRDAHTVRTLERRGKKLGAVLRELILEALEARELAARNKAREAAPLDIGAEIERLRLFGGTIQGSVIPAEPTPGPADTREVV